MHVIFRAWVCACSRAHSRVTCVCLHNCKMILISNTNWHVPSSARVCVSAFWWQHVCITFQLSLIYKFYLHHKSLLNTKWTKWSYPLDVISIFRRDEGVKTRIKDGNPGCPHRVSINHLHKMPCALIVSAVRSTSNRIVLQRTDYASDCCHGSRSSSLSPPASRHDCFLRSESLCRSLVWCSALFKLWKLFGL